MSKKLELDWLENLLTKEQWKQVFVNTTKIKERSRGKRDTNLKY